MMIVQEADRFGLAQLHQLRGRSVAGPPSRTASSSDASDETARARLTAITELRDGFELAERDFELRREGDVLGFAQSGRSGLRVASLTRTVTAAVRARGGRRPCSTTVRLDAEARPTRRSPRNCDPAGCAAFAAADPRPVPDAGEVGSSPGRPGASASRRPVAGTRPLGDRVKQTLFAVLDPELPGAISTSSGSGAGGIEALRRGADHATFVERDPGAARTIVANLARPTSPARTG